MISRGQLFYDFPHIISFALSLPLSLQVIMLRRETGSTTRRRHLRFLLLWLYVVCCILRMLPSSFFGGCWRVASSCRAAARRRGRTRGGVPGEAQMGGGGFYHSTVAGVGAPGAPPPPRTLCAAEGARKTYATMLQRTVAHLGLAGVVPVDRLGALGVEGDGDDGPLRVVVGLEAVDGVGDLVRHAGTVVPLRLRRPNNRKIEEEMARAGWLG